ncbi:MAG: metallophosphoesterase [Granulicella sp.]
MSGITHEMPPPTRQQVANGVTRRDFLAGAAAIAAGITLNAGLIARHTIDLVSQTLPINRLPDAFHGFRIIQLSDIHLDEFTEPAFLKLVLYRINQLAPDLVLLTGDFASYGPLPLSYSRKSILRCADILKALACPQRFAILGNHDTTIGSRFVVAALAASNIPTLVNSYVPIERGNQRFWLGGVDDPGTSYPILDLAVPQHPDGPVILMAHPPDFADAVAQHPRGPLVDVMLSGHTHGGQVCLPFLGPLVLPPMGKKYVAGLFRFNQMQLYVNRGIGTTGVPFRLNCPPEITLLTLQPAKSSTAS